MIRDYQDHIKHVEQRLDEDERDENENYILSCQMQEELQQEPCFWLDLREWWISKFGNLVL